MIKTIQNPYEHSKAVQYRQLELIMITAEELHESLSSVSIGASTCNFSFEKCEELTPTINEINQLKKEKKCNYFGALLCKS